MSPDTDADGDRHGRTKDPREAELEAIVEDLWQQYESLRQQRGSPSKADTIKKAGLKSTVYDWLDKKNVMPDWPPFAALVTALEDKPTHWHPRWTSARAAYDDLKSLRAKRSRSDTPPPEARPVRAPDKDQSEPEPVSPDILDSQASGDMDSGNDVRAAGEAKPRRAVAGAFSAIWKRLGRSKAQRVAVAAVLVVAIAVGVIVTVPKIWASSSDEPNGPMRLPLLRYQAPTPDRANFISPTEPGPPGWIALPSLGEVYAPNVTGGVPGLVPIHRYRCANCQTLVYFLSRDSSQRANFEFEAEAFRCFDPNNPPSGTRPLQSLSNNKTHARIWAIPGTSEHQEAIANGFKDPNPDGLPLCYIW